jgi:sugar phosphate isomerase/epimerase
MSIHPRLSVNSMCLGDSPLADDCTWARSIGARWISVSPAKLEAAGWDAGIETVQRSGLQVSTLVSGASFQLERRDTWPEQQAAARRVIDAAATMSARSLYGVTGPLGRLTFEEGASAYRDAMAPLLPYADAAGVALALETLNPVYINMNLCGGLQDAMEVAELAGVSLCLDVSGFFAESHLLEKLARAAPRTALVQVSDTVYGEIGRAVPGDGDIPLDRILGWILAAGYEGPFDIELNGRRIDHEGYRTASVRAAVVLTDILDRLGA